MEVPCDTPVTTPELVPMVATAVLPLTHVPLMGVAINGSVANTQTGLLLVMMGVESTVTV
jgi:hypothetical protein